MTRHAVADGHRGSVGDELLGPSGNCEGPKRTTLKTASPTPSGEVVDDDQLEQNHDEGPKGSGREDPDLFDRVPGAWVGGGWQLQAPNQLGHFLAAIAGYRSSTEEADALIASRLGAPDDRS